MQIILYKLIVLCFLRRRRRIRELKSFKNKASKFSYSHTFRQNEKETHELYKQEKGKRKVKNSAAVFVDVPVLAA